MTGHNAEEVRPDEGCYVVKVTTWHRIPRADMEPLDTQRDVAEWIADEYLGPAPFITDYDVTYATLEVRAKGSLANVTLPMPHWRDAKLLREERLAKHFDGSGEGS